MARPIVAVCLHDGFYGCGTGAGHSNRTFLDALTTLLADRAELLVLPIWIRESSPEYDGHWHAETRHSLGRAGARVIPLDNGTRGRTRWGTGLGSFRAACAHAARVLVTETAGRPRLIVALDVPFFGLSPLLPPDLLTDVVLVPRSTAVIHAPDERDRVAWERRGLATGVGGGARVGTISRYMRQHLTADYGLPSSAFVDLPVGLQPGAWTRTPPPDDLVPTPARTGFWLAMGRAVPYKGFDDLLGAIAIIRQTRYRPPHLVLAAVSNKLNSTDYQRHLAGRFHELGIDGTLITRFSPRVADLLAHPALAGVIVPSRAEPFGRIPLEAHAAGAAPVIATTAGGLAEQIIDGETGFLSEPDNPRDLAEALTRAVRLTDQQRQSMRVAAHASVANHRDHAQAVGDFLRAVAPNLLATAESRATRRGLRQVSRTARTCPPTG